MTIRIKLIVIDAFNMSILKFNCLFTLLYKQYFFIFFSNLRMLLKYGNNIF